MLLTVKDFFMCLFGMNVLTHVPCSFAWEFPIKTRVACERTCLLFCCVNLSFSADAVLSWIKYSTQYFYIMVTDLLRQSYSSYGQQTVVRSRKRLRCIVNNG